MSIAALKWVFDDADAPTAHAMLVLMVYANFANEHGRAYPSTETVAAKTRQNVKTVRAAIDALELADLLVDTGKRVGRTGNVKVYALGMEGLPKVGALKGEHAPDAAQVPQEPQEEAPAKALPKTGGLKAPVPGSKGTRSREAEPVLEPSTPENADAFSAPRGAKDDGGVAGGWKPPAIADLPQPARSIAEQWPSGAYADIAAGHAAYCQSRGRRGRRADPQATWIARIIDLGARPIRDAAAGLRYGGTGAPAPAPCPGDRSTQLERSAAMLERMGRAGEAEEMRRQAQDARGGR